MKKRIALFSALLGALGSVAAMAQTNVYSLHAISGGESIGVMEKLKANGVKSVEMPLGSLVLSQPSFQEVYQLLSTNLEGVSAEELNTAAVQGLIHQLEPRVSLVAAEAGSSNAAPLAEARVFDGSYAYFRVGGVNSNLSAAFRAA